MALGRISTSLQGINWDELNKSYQKSNRPTPGAASATDAGKARKAPFPALSAHS